MKLFYLFLFIFITTHSQTNFEEYYKKATEDYDNNVLRSIYYDKAIESCDDITQYPELLRYKASDLFYKNKLLLSIKYLELAKLYTKENEDLLLINNNLGLIYLELEKPEKALNFFKTNLALSKKLKNEYYKNESLFNTLLYKYEYDETPPTIDEFWSFYNGLLKKTTEEKFEYLNIFIEINNENEQFNEAQKLVDHIYKNFRVNQFSKKLIGFFYFNNTLLNIQTKNYDTALKYSDSSYAISKKHLGKDEILEDYLNYKEIYEGKQLLVVALKYVDSINELENTMTNINIDSGIELLDDNILFNKTLQKTNKKISAFKITIIIVIGVTILILLFFLLKSSKQKKNLQKINSELILNKGKYNKSIKDNINFKTKVKQLLKEKNFDELQKIQKQYEIEDLNTEVYIKYLASEIDTDFLNKLKPYNFNLNEIEKLLLFYRKNNHTYKEISIITNRTLRSIQGLSYRLNKKITSETNLSLIEFLEKM